MISFSFGLKITLKVYFEIVFVFNFPSAMTSCSSPRSSNTALCLYSAQQKPHFD